MTLLAYCQTSLTPRFYLVKTFLVLLWICLACLIQITNCLYQPHWPYDQIFHGSRQTPKQRWHWLLPVHSCEQLKWKGKPAVAVNWRSRFFAGKISAWLDDSGQEVCKHVLCCKIGCAYFFCFIKKTALLDIASSLLQGAYGERKWGPGASPLMQIFTKYAWQQQTFAKATLNASITFELIM